MSFLLLSIQWKFSAPSKTITYGYSSRLLEPNKNNITTKNFEVTVNHAWDDKLQFLQVLCHQNIRRNVWLTNQHKSLATGLDKTPTGVGWTASKNMIFCQLKLVVFVNQNRIYYKQYTSIHVYLLHAVLVDKTLLVPADNISVQLTICHPHFRLTILDKKTYSIWLTASWSYCYKTGVR